VSRNLCGEMILMLDLQKYSCLGAALRDALDRFAGETCLIEADRDREKTRLTYSDFKEMAACRWRARWKMRILMPGDRAAILMTNQSKWLISAYAFSIAAGCWFRWITN
jgi:acyl-CoA synthetase (AMP-forming)/AMP-acid ligase II